MSSDRSTLLERIGAGDAGAVKQCMDTYGGLVWSLARRYLPSVDDAEDATQEIFVEVWKSASRYQPSMGKEATFIATIARRRLIDRVRAASRRPISEEFDESISHEGQLEERGLGDVAVDIAAAQKALAVLNEDQRSILLLGIVEGLSHSEIATKTGKPLGTVKTQMRRGLAKLRSLLEETDPKSVVGSIAFVVGSVFLAAADVRSDEIPDDLYERLLQQGQQLVRGSD